jgi:hypothetical protein
MAQIQSAYQLQILADLEQFRREAERLPHCCARDSILERIRRMEHLAAPVSVVHVTKVSETEKMSKQLSGHSAG